MRAALIGIVALLSSAQSSTSTRTTVTPADSALATIERAAQAMGGREALLTIRTVDRQIRSDISDPTQGARPARPGELDPPVYLSGQRTVFTDYAGNRQRTTADGAIYGGQPSRFLRVDRPDSSLIANLTLRTRQAFPGGPRGAPVGQFQPEGLIRRALQNPDSLFWVGTRREGNREVNVIRFGDRGFPFPLRLLFDQETGLLLALETDNDDAVLGDVLTRVSFSDWHKSGALQLPWVQEQRRNGVRYQRFTTTALQLDRDCPDSLFAIPAGLDQDEQPPQQLAASSIGRDLYLLRAAYNSLFVVLDDHVVVIEAPVNSRRSTQALAEIHRVAPGKPVRYVVSTHFHSDHIGGLRPFIAEGATIITTPSARQVILDFLTQGGRTRTVDTLSRVPRAPVIELAGRKRVLRDASHRIEVLDVSPNPHAEEILVVWFPGERILFEGDMLDLLVPENRPSMPGDDTRALGKSIGKLGLDVDRIIPVHGRPGTRADLDRTLARIEQ